MRPPEAIPVVMTFAGADPTGGAGIQADIEALASVGCHAAPVVTAVTVQDTQGVKGFVPLDPGLVVEQARAVLEDMPVAAVKIGLLGSVENVGSVHTLLTDYPRLPVVMDPVITSGDGRSLAEEGVLTALLTLLLPMTTVLVPSSREARMLAPEADTLDACAMALLDRGCEYVLMTGTHEQTREVANTLYGNRRALETYRRERIPGTFHGAGCTLTAALAGRLAQGLEPLSAVHEAQEYAWECLRTGYRLGMGRQIPNRLYWARGAPEGSG
jgi:hydroxymethylpyrimidine/phosphomethylpyrimidine kinase